MKKRLKAVAREEAELARIYRGHGRPSDKELKFPLLTRNMTPMDLEAFQRKLARRLPRG